MNPFRQRIGIWYKDTEWRDKIFEEIVNTISQECISRIHNSQNEKRINLIDGSFIIMLSANLMSRGNALSKAYIQDGISLEIYNTIISPCIKPYFLEAIVVDKFDDFYCGRVANSFYWKEREEN